MKAMSRLAQPTRTFKELIPGRSQCLPGDEAPVAPNRRVNCLIALPTNRSVHRGSRLPPASKHNNEGNDKQDAHRNRQNLDEIVVGSLTLRSLYYLGGHNQSLSPDHKLAIPLIVPGYPTTIQAAEAPQTFPVCRHF